MNQFITYILFFITSFANISSGDVNVSEMSSKLQNKNISQIISLIYQNTPINSWCQISLSGENVYIWGKCAKEDFDKQLSDIVKKDIYSISDTLRPNISWWTSGYNQNSTEFLYTGSKPIFAQNDLVNVKNLFSGDLSEKIYILSKYSDSNIYIPIMDIENYISENFITRSVANRDIKLYSACQKQNFDIAMDKLKSVKLSPNQKLNVNSELTNLSWYCTWPEGGWLYMFYQWVCGTSTLFFRNALVNPNIYITKRQWHSNWFTKYYGDYIYGDDAAIYEMQKQFEIQNKSDYDIYIKFWTNWDLHKDTDKYLVSISPKGSDRLIIITKWESSWGIYQAILTKNIYSGYILTWSEIETWTFLSWVSQKWISNYYNKLYDTD